LHFARPRKKKKKESLFFFVGGPEKKGGEKKEKKKEGKSASTFRTKQTFRPPQGKEGREKGSLLFITRCANSTGQVKKGGGRGIFSY